MPRLAAAVPAALVALLALLAACSSGGSTGAPASTGATTVPATAPATTTTVAPTTTTVPLQPRPDPPTAARALLDAWEAGDAAAAATVAVPAAVDALFGAGTPGAIQDRGCSDARFDPVHCVYRTDAGEVQVRVTAQGDGWVVDQARVTPA